MNKEALNLKYEILNKSPLSLKSRQASPQAAFAEAAREKTPINQKPTHKFHPPSTIHHPRYLALIVLLFIFLPARSQDSPSVKTQIDKTHILIGEQFRLGIDVIVPAGTTLELPRLDTLPHFVLLEKGSVDSLTTGTSRSYHLEWRLTSFDSGVCKIPALPLFIGNRQYQSDSLLVDVSYGENVDSLKEYHDIRGIIDIENPAVKYILWIVLGLTILAILLYMLTASKRLAVGPVAEEGAPGKVSLSPFEEAMASLDALKKMPFSDPASVKKYYSGMNDTLRIYLSRSMGLSTMERTNEELILQLSRLDMGKESFTHLAGSLRMSDFVKFAKYIPDVYDNERNLEVIRSSIVLINEIRK
jgi:hypothetical protein